MGKLDCARYMNAAFLPETRRLVINQAVKRLKFLNMKFSAIACRGVSGMAIAPSIADKLGKSLIIVRKGETNHSGNSVEGLSVACKYIIIDDLIDTGQTVHKIIDDISTYLNNKDKCVGAYLYQSTYWCYPKSYTEDMRYPIPILNEDYDNIKRKITRYIDPDYYR